MSSTRKTIRWREKFYELAGLMIGPDCIGKSPEEVMAEAKEASQVVRGVLFEVRDALISALDQGKK